MNFSWKIFTAFGIPVRLHFSMVLIPFLAFTWVDGTGTVEMILAAVLSVLLFGSVLLHEFGHALTGRRYGVHTQDIVLTPIGGMARMTNIPQRPKEEIAISIAGPLVSFAIAGVSYAILFAEPYLRMVPTFAFDMFHVLFQLNLMLGLFNLIPALPMDGGRVFRGLLALKYSHLRATQIASKIGKALAVLGGIYGIMNSRWTLVFIAFFIYTAAGQEERIASMREAYKRARKDGMPAGGFPFSGAAPSHRPDSPMGGHGYYVYQESRRGPSTHSADSDWRDDSASPRKVKVVEGGKVEILSRKDPE